MNPYRSLSGKPIASVPLYSLPKVELKKSDYGTLTHPWSQDQLNKMANEDYAVTHKIYDKNFEDSLLRLEYERLKRNVNEPNNDEELLNGPQVPARK